MLLRKRFKQLRQVLLADTYSGIANLKAKRSVGRSIQPTSNRPALGKLDRVVQQIREGLRQTVLVEDHACAGCIDCTCQRNALAFGYKSKIRKQALQQETDLQPDRHQAEGIRLDF